MRGSSLRCLPCAMRSWSASHRAVHTVRTMRRPSATSAARVCSISNGPHCLYQQRPSGLFARGCTHLDDILLPDVPLPAYADDLVPSEEILFRAPAQQRAFPCQHRAHRLSAWDECTRSCQFRTRGTRVCMGRGMRDVSTASCFKFYARTPQGIEFSHVCNLEWWCPLASKRWRLAANSRRERSARRKNSSVSNGLRRKRMYGTESLLPCNVYSTVARGNVAARCVQHCCEESLFSRLRSIGLAASQSRSSTW